VRGRKPNRALRPRHPSRNGGEYRSVRPSSKCADRASLRESAPPGPRSPARPASALSSPATGVPIVSSMAVAVVMGPAAASVTPGRHAGVPVCWNLRINQEQEIECLTHSQ
jgi:hypothetical protein